MSLLSKYINRQLAAYQSELVQTHYQEVENMYRQIRGWRHDYRNHIQVLKAHIVLLYSVEDVLHPRTGMVPHKKAAPSHQRFQRLTA